MKEEIEMLREALRQSKEANKRIKEEARFNDYQKLQSKYYKVVEENKRLREELYNFEKQKKRRGAKII